MERKDLKNIAIHCKTEEEANKVRTIAQNLGWKWNTGKDYTDTDWLAYNTRTCYDFYKGYCAPKFIYEDFGYEIMPAQWFLDNFGDKEQKIDEENELSKELKKWGKILIILLCLISFVSSLYLWSYVIYLNKIVENHAVIIKDVTKVLDEQTNYNFCNSHKL